MGSTKSIQRLVFMLLLTLSVVTAMPATLTRPADAAQNITVNIADLAFNPQNVTIKVGSTITWINNDPLIYTLWFVKADDLTTYKKAGREGLSDPILPGASWSQTFDEIVTLKYHSLERLWITGFITVVPLVPPTASFTYSPSKPAVSQTTTFNASDSFDPDGVIMNYAWDFDDGTVPVVSVREIITHVFTSAGTYTVTLNVTDDDGLSDSTSQSVKVYVLPVARFTYLPDEPLVNQDVTFNASSSTPDGGTLTDPDSYAWDFDSDGSVDDYGKIVTHAFATHGDYMVNLTVTDSHGLSNSAFQSVKVYALPVASFSYLPLAPVVDETVTFDASASSDPDGTIANYTWDFDDGNVTVVTQATVTHVYASVGAYNVNLTVTDSDGLTDIYAASVIVGKRTSTITVSASPTSITIGESISISGSITPVRAEVTVTIEYRESGETTWNLLATAQTDGSSQYSYTWTDATEGEYELRATWAGDANTLADESDVETVTVLQIHDITIMSVIPSQTEVTSGDNVTITVVVENEGTVAETFTVTVYSNNTLVDTQSVTDLDAGASETLDFVWDTSNATEGTYVIKAEASQVTGETDIADNTLISEVTVTIRGAPFVIFPYIGIMLILIAILIIVLGGFIYLRRRKTSEG